ncbi:MAG TPA: flagellar basal body L-ring protein FlgH [Methylomirabilota bacterium]|nr:flagellar basal body L-ring protein FlgH [Methylomirabilota bacterium]
MFPRFEWKPVVSLALAVALAPALQAFPGLKKSKNDSTSHYLDEYLKRARSMNLPAPETPGSLWVASGPLSTLATDYKARNAGDLIIIHLVDSFSAATNGENKQQRQFAANSSVTNLIGKLGANNRLQNLLNGTSSNSLDGKGQSTMSSNVSMNLAAQVIEVLPNGVLVVQAARDITLGNDRQTVILRGLVRPGDLASDNSISSNSIADLEVEIKGKGAVAEASRQPNFLVRALLRLFTF